MMRGFSTLEILIALMVMSMTLIAVTLVSFGMPGVVASAGDHRQALALAQAMLEREYARGDDGFALTVSVASTSEGSFTSSLAVELLADGLEKRLTARTSWQDLWGTFHVVSLAGLVTDYAHAAGASPCNPLPSGDWEHPVSSAYVGTLPPITALAATHDFLVAATSATASVADPTLFLIPLENSAMGSSYASTFDPATSTKAGFVALAAHGDLIFAGSNGACTSGQESCAQIQVIDARDRSVLTRISSFTPGPIRSLAYAGGRLYAGLESSAAAEEFLVLDVSDPAHMRAIASAEIGRSVNDIAIGRDAAYIATTDNRAGGKAVQKFPLNALSMHMSPVTVSAQQGGGFAERLAYAGSVLYLGRSALANSKELYALSLPSLAGVSLAEMNESVRGLIVRDYLAQVLMPNAFETWNVGAAPAVRVRVLAPEPAHTFSAMTCSGDNIFVAAITSTNGYLTSYEGS